MQKFLACCEEIEQTVSEVYRHWEQTYRDDEEFSRLWRELADDELTHVNQIRLARRLPVDELFAETQIDVSTIEMLLAQARKLLADVKKVTISKEKALHTAIKMESAFSEAHIENVGRFVNPAMKSMFTSLSRDDEQHMATLQNYCDRFFGKTEI